MNKPSDQNTSSTNHKEPRKTDTKTLREKLIGLGETSVRKSYYPELQHQLSELERFRALLNHSNDAIFLVRTDTGALVDHNHTACQLGICVSEADGSCSPTMEIFRLAPVMEAIDRLNQGFSETEMVETEFDTPTLGTLFLEISLSAVFFAQTKYAVVVARDATQRYQTQKALQRSQIIDATLADLSSSLLRYTSIEDITDKVLSAARTLTKSPAGFVATLDQNATRLHIKSLYCNGITLDTSDEHIPYFDHFGGLWGWVLQHKIPLLTNDVHNDPRSEGLPNNHLDIRHFLCVPAMSNDNVVGIIALANAPDGYASEDEAVITRLSLPFTLALQRKRFEQEIMEGKEAAEAANLAKSEFLANMSHEIRTPLNAVLGMLQILQNAGLNKEQEEYVEIGIQSGHGLLSLMDDVLSLSAMESGHSPLRHRSFDLMELLTNVADGFQPQTKDKPFTLTYGYDNSIPSQVMGDPSRLRQILFNLVGNAIKFTKQGNVHINAWSIAKSSGKGFNLLLQVADTGIGIPLEKQHTIWEMFTQVDGSSTRRHEGTGLGLHLVRRQVETLGGEICVDSELGKGTTFYVLIPFVHGLTSPKTITTPLARPIKSGLRVLVAEDDAINRLTLERFLHKLGHKCHCVENGLEAIEAVRLQQFDVVLMDIQMPRLDGLAATRSIRTSTNISNPNLPIVALTAYALEGDRERFLAGGMDEHLAKPVDLIALERVLQNVVND